MILPVRETGTPTPVRGIAEAPVDSAEVGRTTIRSARAVDRAGKATCARRGFAIDALVNERTTIGTAGQARPPTV